MEPPADLDDARERPRPRRGVAFWSVLGVGLAVALAGVAKPVHVDDALYLNIARWIARHPLDPFGGTINWQQIPEPAYNVSISPPLLSYAFALVIAVAGEDVPLLHVVMIPFVLLACWAIYRLAERWTDAGAAVALAVMLGPAVVAGLNLMLDVPLLACFAAALECALRGVERRSPPWHLGAALFGALGVLIKFPALALVPLFLVVALRRRRWGPLLAAAGPLTALIAWQAASRSLYGAGQVHAGLSFLSQFRATFFRLVVERTLTMFAILAWTFPFGWLVPWGLGRRGRIGSAFAALLLAAAAAAMLGEAAWRRPWVSVAFVVGVGLGSYGFTAAMLSGAPAAAKLGPSAVDERPLLRAWILGVLAIVIPFGPFVAVRSFLPIHAPLAILLLYRRAPTRGRLGAAVGLSAVLGVALGAADYHWAACYPAAAQRLAAELGPTGRPVVFLGHWGWQYYAERAGFQAWDARRREAPAGAFVIVPLRADRQWLHPDVVRRFRFRDRIAFPPGPLGLTTWNRRLGLRFYGGDYGELPWGFSTEPAEEFFVSEVGPAPP